MHPLIVDSFGRTALKHAQFTALQEYVTEALEMIREGQASEALSYLRTESRELRMSGYELVENNLIFLPTFTMDSIRYVLNLLAQRSICRHDKKHIMPSVGAVIARLTPHTDEERGLLAIWEKNVALIYAEE